MNAAEAQTLREENNKLALENATLRRRLENLEQQAVHQRDQNLSRQRGAEPGPRGADTPPRSPVVSPDAAGRTNRGLSVEETFDADALYQALYTRLIHDAQSDPTLLRIIATRPELEVSVRRVTVDASNDTLRGRLAVLISEGFFDEIVGGTTALKELNRRGIGSAKPNVYKELEKLVTMGFLTKEEGGFGTVPGMKVRILET